jgi:hypothetical protein
MTTFIDVLMGSLTVAALADGVERAATGIAPLGLAQK